MIRAFNKFSASLSSASNFSIISLKQGQLCFDFHGIERCSTFAERCPTFAELCSAQTVQRSGNAW